MKAFIFDLDGVITETADLHFKAWRDEVKKVGIDYTEEVNAKFKGLPRMDTLNAILNEYGVTSLTEEQKIEMATNKNNDYLELLETNITSKNILPGIEKLLENAKKGNIKMAIASSSKNAPLILEKTGLRHYFEYIVNPEHIKNGKPSPDIYLDAANGINVDVKDCVGFEDAMPGVEGLLKANMFTIAITHGDEGDWNKAQMVLGSTSELSFNEIKEKYAAANI